MSAALAHYGAAIAADPKNYDALCKASRTEADVGEGLAKGVLQDSAYAAAVRFARQAIAVDARDAGGHFALARAAGRQALTMGGMGRIRAAKLVRSEAMKALEYDSLHAGALHVLGVWNAEVMRLNGLSRSFARTFLGAEVFGRASWSEATRLLERCITLEPDRIVHHLDLAAVYADTHETAKARRELEWIARAPLKDINDALYKQRAADRLRTL
ncbi:MAG: hypothetical protein HYR75_09290 [Gemmatimonadetes bacterium]|nr:hypothetical protein [Gemmatimonadota bacterium]MBI3568353.1 hypothetical protein [Gemmatimonadota bacterium]